MLLTGLLWIQCITRSDGKNHAKVRTVTLRKKCPNTEFFLVRILPQSDWILRDTEYLSAFNPNAENYWQEKTPYLDPFHVV